MRATTTQFKVNGLIRNSYYYFRISAENSIGMSEPLENEQAIQAKPAYSVPSAPTGPLCITEMKQTGCTLLWAPPGDDGGSRVTSYVVEAREARRATWYQVDVVDASENQYKVTDLVEHNSYYFRVSAKNSMGQGEALESSPAVVIKRPPGPPDSPFPLVVSDVQVDNCTLEWKPPQWTGGESLGGYHVERRTGDDGSGEWKRIAELSPSLRKHTVQNLYEGTEYYFRMSAYNTKGESVPLELSRPVIPKRQLTCPAKPQGPVQTVETTRDSITIQWVGPKHDGGASLSRYTVYYREYNTQNWSRGGWVDPDATMYTVENLTENADYHFRIVAENKIGHSDYLQTAEPIKAKSPYSVPSRPEGPLSVLEVSESTATVQWSSPANNGGSIVTGYVVMRRDVKRPIWVRCGRVNADQLSFKIRDLAEGSEYAVQVFAENIEGLSAEPLESDKPVAPRRPHGPPSKPSSFECIGVDTSSITLQWEQPLNDGGSQIKSYKLEVKDDKTGKWRIVKQDIDLLNTSYCVKDLKEGHRYLFRISAANEKGTGEAMELDRPVTPRKKVEAPSQPQGPLRVTDMDETSMTVSWTQSSPECEDLTAYVIEVRESIKAHWTQVASVKSHQSSYKIGDLTENSDYYVRVRAQNEAGLYSQALESDSFITVKSAYTVPSAPRDLKLCSVGQNSATLEFKEPEQSGNCDIRHFIVEKRDSKRVTWVKACKVRALAAKSEDGQAHVYRCEAVELSPGGTYYFRVLAENQKGVSEACELSAHVTIEREVEAPSKPHNVQLVKQKRPNSVMLEWKAPLFNGNESIHEYVIEQWSSDSDEWKVIHRSSGFESHYYVNNLEDGHSYKFRISAANAHATSEPSMETYEFVCLDASPPSHPAGPLKYSVSEDQFTINLEWAAPKSTGGSHIKRYIVERKQLGSSQEWSKVGSTSDCHYALTEYSIEDCTWSFRVTAENAEGLKSQPLELTQPIRMERRKQLPEPPSYLRVKEKTATSISLTWKSFSVDAYSEADRFYVETREKNSLEWARVGQAYHEAFTCDNLNSQSSYYFRVLAVNSAGESVATELPDIVSMDISDEVPSAPVSLSVDDVSEDSVTLSWISPANSGLKPVVGYKIFRQAGNSSEWELCGHIHRSKQLSYTVTDLDFNSQYKFRVCAVSGMGLGKAAETSKMHIKKPIQPPSEPVGLFVKSVGNGEISITWMSPEETGGSPITEYHIYRSEIVNVTDPVCHVDIDGTNELVELASRWIRHEIVDRYTLDFRFKHLNVGGKYNVRVAAMNAAGLSKSAEIREPVIARALYSPPDAPVGPILLTNITRETVDASWQAPRYDGGSPLQSYYVEKRDLRENIWIKVARIDADCTTLKIINVVEAHKYEIRVSAENEHGKSEPLTSEPIKPLRIFGELKHKLKIGYYLLLFDVFEN